MDLSKTFRIIVGVLLLLSSTTLLALLFLEPDSLAIIFNFSIDVTASNLGEAIAGAIAGIAAGFVFLIGMLILGTLNFIFYLIIGSIRLALKRSKTMSIFVIILTSFALLLETRTLILLTLGGFTSILLTLYVIGDVIIITFSLYLLIHIFRTPEIDTRQ
ncbi:MAG: hypothetical protein HWN80_05755 [Candidatus Lokiarchaeota archaeon]|nr:hypothetical protein [Candidatus Lokiarchaeota archaeon]